MRVDLLMNKLCLVKTRTISKKACDKGLVKINEKPIKASASINVSDLLEYTIYGYKNIIKITKLPDGNVSKKDSPEYYETIERIKIAED